MGAALGEVEVVEPGLQGGGQGQGVVAAGGHLDVDVEPGLQGGGQGQMMLAGGEVVEPGGEEGEQESFPVAVYVVCIYQGPK